MKRAKRMVLDPKVSNWSNLTKAYSADRYFGVNYGYLGCVHVDKMNRFGVHAGYESWSYLIRNDKLIDMTLPYVDCNSIYRVLGIYGIPTAAQIAAADYGSIPKNPQQTVMEYMKTVLRYPENARYDKWSNLRKGWLPGDKDEDEDEDVIHYGYMGCVSIKGTYGGFRQAAYIIKHDKVITAVGFAKKGGNFNNTENADFMEQLIINLCDPLYQTNTNAEAVKTNAGPGQVTPRQQANPQEQRVNPKPLPIRVTY